MKEPKIRFKGFSEEWEEKKLGATALSICSGKSNNVPGPYPLYGSTGVIGTTDKNIYRGIKLLVARVGANAGHLQLVNIDCGVSDNTLIIQLDGELSYTYLLYFFLHYKLNRFIYGSGQPLITGGMLKQVSIFFGNIREREMIATYCQHLDALIQSTTKKIESLKQVKAASLQSMFPQEGETTPRVRFKGFEGEWEETTIGESMVINSGMDYKHLSEGDVPVYGTGGYMLSVNECLSEVDAIGIGRKGTIDKPQLLKAPFWTVDTLFFLTPQNRDLHFLYALCQKINWRNYDESTGVPSLSKVSVSKIKFAVPDIAEQRAIASYFTTLDRQITLQTQRLEKLKQIKAACLDKMFV